MNIKPQVSWRKIHYFENDEPSPCTAVAVYEQNEIATVGEDGVINLLSSQSQNIVRRIGR